MNGQKYAKDWKTFTKVEKFRQIWSHWSGADEDEGLRAQNDTILLCNNVHRCLQISTHVDNEEVTQSVKGGVKLDEKGFSNVPNLSSVF